MLSSKRKRMIAYLDSIERQQWSPFEVLLDHCMSDQLFDTIAQIGVTGISCHIDFLDDYKCINIQGRYKSYYVDLQIEQEEFSIGCDSVEPDEHKVFILESPEYLYSIIDAEIKALSDN